MLAVTLLKVLRFIVRVVKKIIFIPHWFCRFHFPGFLPLAVKKIVDKTATIFLYVTEFPRLLRYIWWKLKMFIKCYFCYCELQKIGRDISFPLYLQKKNPEENQSDSITYVSQQQNTTMFKYWDCADQLYIFVLTNGDLQQREWIFCSSVMG